MAQEATPETTGSARPTRYHGKQGEWTVLSPLKPGGADQLRELVSGERDTAGQRQAIAIGTLHDMRVAILDNDSRMLFATVFDGAWDQYIDDFAADPETNAACLRCPNPRSWAGTAPTWPSASCTPTWWSSAST